MALGDVLDRRRHHDGGQVADYIPELAHADPDDFGVAVVSVRGRRYAAGTAAHRFTIQSISKPFVYALALAEHGLDEVARHVGFEPSGEPFNAISLDDDTGRPANPLINAGAIVTSSLISGGSPVERAARIRDALSAVAGRPLDVDDRVRRSESATGDRNRALAHLARAAGVLGREVDDAVEVYFEQCSLLVSCEDIAVMAATLANAGVNPVTGVEVVDEQVARQTLSVMSTCGMYDDSGEWMVRVGLPAKSGVSGGIVAAKPGAFGIGVHSPRLDPQGNSVRGTEALRDLSETFRLHLLAHHAEPRSPIIAVLDGTDGADGVTLELRGELDFLAADEVVDRLTELADRAPRGSRLVLDMTGVTCVRPVAARLLGATFTAMAARGIVLDAVDPTGVAGDARLSAGGNP